MIYVTEYSKQCLAEEQRTCILLSKSSTVWKSVIMSLIMSRARTRAATFAAEWPWFSSPASSMFLWRAGKNYEAGTVYFWLVFCWNCSFCHWNYIIIWHDVHFVLCLEFYFNIYFNKVLAKYCMLHFLTTLPKSKMFGCIAKQAGVNWVYLSQSKPGFRFSITESFSYNDQRVHHGSYSLATCSLFCPIFIPTIVRNKP